MKSILKRVCIGLLALNGANLLAAGAADSAADDRAARMAWWREGRFGMFIHYGPVTLTGGEISWSRANSNPRCPNKGPTPVAVYDSLYQKFNPTEFKAADWAGVAKQAGMKYVVLTAKHCDGFLLWDSKVDDYNIMHTPFKRDICAELVNAVRGAGMHMGWYFSPMDWRDPDCRSADNKRYVAHIQDEMRELLSNYGKIDVFWFDSDGRPTMWSPETTYPLVRGLQPGILINNRLEMATSEQWKNQGTLRGNEDFYTPEQKVGAYDDQHPWETCMTLGTQWSWKPGDAIKSPAGVVDILCRTVGGDGNLLLNVGPMPDGRIEPRQVEVLGKVGAWIDVNGESIYGTRGGPWKPTKEIASTRKGDVVYVHVLNAGSGTIELPALPFKIKVASLLGGAGIRAEVADGKLTLHLTEKNHPLPVVVKLELEGSAMDLPAVEIPATRSSPPTGYRLVWSDDFNGAALDVNRWFYRTGKRLLSVQRPENVSVSNGLLHIALKKEDSAGAHYTAGGVISRKQFKYGYYEARFRCPDAAGWHTSFWTMDYTDPGKLPPGVDFAQQVEQGRVTGANRAKAQEIDICEQDAINTRSYSAGVIDWSGRTGKRSVGFGRKYYRKTPDFSADFHVWGCEFTPSSVKFYLDGKLTHETDAKAFPHGEQNIWLTSVAALWGDPVKPKAVDDARLPATAEFDWVRYYEK